MRAYAIAHRPSSPRGDVNPEVVAVICCQNSSAAKRHAAAQRDEPQALNGGAFNVLPIDLPDDGETRVNGDELIVRLVNRGGLWRFDRAEFEWSESWPSNDVAHRTRVPLTVLWE